MPQYLHKKAASFKHKKHKFSALFPVTAVKRSSGIISSSEAMLVFVYYLSTFFFLSFIIFSVKTARHENSIAAFISCLWQPSVLSVNTQLSFLNTEEAAQKSSGFWHKATFKVRTSKFGQHCGGGGWSGAGAAQRALWLQEKAGLYKLLSMCVSEAHWCAIHNAGRLQGFHMRGAKSFHGDKLCTFFQRYAENSVL